VPTPGAVNKYSNPRAAGDRSRAEGIHVDDARTYLMGHSMGGAGTLYLTITYPRRWAAVAAIAPAAFSVDKEGLARIPKMPIMVVHGDMGQSSRRRSGVRGSKR